MAAKIDMFVQQDTSAGTAALYRMVTAEHICPFGLKA